MQTQQTPKDIDINALVSGAYLERQRTIETMNSRLAEEQAAHVRELGERARKEAEARQKARQDLARQVRDFRRRAREEALRVAPALAQKLLGYLVENLRQGYSPAVYLALNDWVDYADFDRQPDDDDLDEGEPVFDQDDSGFVRLPDCPGLPAVNQRLVVRPWKWDDRLKSYRILRLLEAVGRIFAGSDVALVSYRFEVGHGEMPDAYPEWFQYEVQLVYRPDNYLPNARPLTGYWLNNDPALRLNCGYTIEARELRRF